MKKFTYLTFCIGLFSISALFSQNNAKNSGSFYQTDKIQTAEIMFDTENWDYLLDSLRVNGDQYLVANIKINGELLKDVGVRYAGGKSYQKDGKRNGFEIALNLVDRDQNYMGYSKVRLSNALRDPSMVREVLGFEIARDYMTAPMANYLNLSINGALYGLLINIEAVDDAFLNHHFGSSDGAFIKADPARSKDKPMGCKISIACNLEEDNSLDCYKYNYDMESFSGWDQLMKLTNVLNNDAKSIENILDVDAALWMLAFNNVLVNLNSYSGAVSENYFLYMDKNGKFNPVIWDLNLAFGSYKNTGIGSDLDLNGLQTLDPLLHENSTTKPLISVLLKNKEYNRIYISHVRSILYDWFLTGKYEEKAKAHQTLIKDAFKNDPNAFYDQKDFASSLDQTIGSRSKIPGIVELMSVRTRYLKKTKPLAVFPPEFKTNIVESRAKLSKEPVKSFRIQTMVSEYTKTVNVFYRFPGEKEFLKVAMKDDGKSFDGNKGDNIFGVEIVPPAGQTELEYYFLAENAAALSFDPPNYYFKQHTVSLADLNE
ncbi:MAG: CotH kinase family protein [Saprospiraceae bacterium]|nr:CotH kinase family protein [Saprospiraceae bacterium]